MAKILFVALMFPCVLISLFLYLMWFD